jgi:DNA-directed RNA polymerase specialized sigma subunit
MTREELNSIPVMQKSIDRKLERIEYLRAKSTATPPMTTDDRVQTTVTNKSMIVSDTLVDLEAEITEDMAELKRMKRRARLFIEQSQLTKIEKELMKLRYVDCLYWSDVGDIMCYHPVYVRQMHSDILSRLFQ